MSAPNVVIKKQPINGYQKISNERITMILDWEKVSVSQTDLDDAIGDVETALENIIQKYGLGGDAQ